MLLAVLGVPACSGSDAAVAPSAVDGARPGGTLRVGVLAPRNIAPWLVSAYDPTGSLIVRTMCDQLVQWEPASGDITAALATSWRVSSPTSLIFKLRKGLTFADGREVKGDDIVTSLSRAADSEVASPVGELLEPIAGALALRGLRQLSADARSRERLLGITSPSPTTLQVTMAGNRADYLRAFGHSFASVVPLADYRRDRVALERKPVCVGPYQLSEPWTPSQKVIRLERAKAYHGANGGYSRNGRGYADVIEFHVFPTPAAILTAYQKKAVDVAYLDPEVAVPPAVATDLVVAPTPTVEYIGLPVSRAPFDQQVVRLALSIALDREAIAKAVYGGRRTPITRLLPQAVGDDYDVEQTTGPKSPCLGAAPARADIAAARQALARTKVSLTGTAVTLYYNDEYANKKLVTEVARQWTAAFGMRVRLSGLTGAEYTTRGTSTAGFDGPFRFSWSPQVPDADAYLTPLLNTAGLGANNFSRLADNQLDFVLDDRARGSEDDDTRLTSYLLAEKMACTTMALIPVVQGGRPYLVRRSTVRSAVDHYAERSTGHVPLRELFLSQEK